MIIGFEGGIGTGKTLSLVYFGLLDLKEGKKLYSNIKLKEKGNIKYLTKDLINNIFEVIKTGKMKMKNSTVLIQEAHNYLDSRSSMSKKNRTLTYWILQSRHTGVGSCSIIYDTQDFGQIDIRLRRNTDYYFRPYIVAWKNKKPVTIRLDGYGKVLHKYTRFNINIDVRGVCDKYDTHEIVDF